MARFKIKIGKEEITLTPKQKLFCELYTNFDEHFANGTQSYAQAYNIDLSTKKGYTTASSGASENLTKPNILAYINHLLDLGGLNHEFVDKQLSFLITQNADLSVKKAAISEYNKLKSRVTKKVDINQKGRVKIRKNRKGEIIKEYID